MIRNYIRIAFRDFTNTVFILFCKVDDDNAGHLFLPAFASIPPNLPPECDEDQYGSKFPLNNIPAGLQRAGSVLPMLFPRLPICFNIKITLFIP